MAKRARKKRSQRKRRQEEEEEEEEPVVAASKDEDDENDAVVKTTAAAKKEGERDVHDDENDDDDDKLLLLSSSSQKTTKSNKRKRSEKKQEKKKKKPSAGEDKNDTTTESKDLSSSSSEGTDPNTTRPLKKDTKKKKKDDDKTSSTSNSHQLETFESLAQPISLCRGVLDYCQSQKFTNMTPVQAATIPLFLSHKDVAVQALTGSGKTLAFLIPIVECLKRKKYKKQEVGALILSPTRELAHQTHAVATQLVASCRKYDKHMTPPLLLVGGGGGGNNKSGSSTNHRPVTADLEAFQRLGSDILIGTPGRVEDVLTKYSGTSGGARYILDCSELDVLILDEADVLLDMGFSMCLQKILTKLPKMRRTGLFSATTSSSNATSITSSLKEWIKKAGMRNPVWIDVAVTNNNNNNTLETEAKSNDDDKNKSAESQLSIKPSKKSSKDVQQHQQQATPTSLTNYYLVTALDEKLSRLATFLRQHAHEKIIVFFLTCSCVEFYGAALQKVFASEKSDICIEMLHGKLVQKRREKTMERFRQGSSTAAAEATAKGDDERNSSNNSSTVLFCTDVAARGLDVSNVHWVVQFDAPQDPAFYIHRVGRCARAGRKGSSLLFLTPKEEAYIDFLQNRKVPLLALPSTVSDDKSKMTERCTGLLARTAAAASAAAVDSGNDNDSSTTSNGNDDDEKKRPTSSASAPSDNEPKEIIQDILPKVRDLVLRDRDILEKGTKAFTSYIRAYKEHRCAFIFRFASLDLGVLATSFCLLRLPKMPELRDILQRYKGRLPNFTPAGPDVDIYAIAYQDKHREAARQKRLAADIAAGGKNAKLIQAERKKAQKERQAAQRRQAALDKGRNPDKKRSKHAQIVDDWNDLAKEERLFKKLRKGKITKEEYDDELYGNV